MALILAFNTAAKENSLALLNEKRVLEEANWISENNDSAKVLPEAVRLLEQAGKSWNDLTAIFVVKGPGSYTRLRVGITIANSLAWILKIPMQTADVFELWENRIALKERSRNHAVVIGAGRGRYLFQAPETSLRMETLDDIEAMGYPCYGEVPSESRLFRSVTRSFGEAVIDLARRSLPTVPQVNPVYFQPPNITLAKQWNPPQNLSSRPSNRR